MRAAATKRLTAKAFARLAPDLGPSELERGEVVTLSPGGMPHSRCSVTIAYLVEGWARRTRRGRVFSNEMGLITSRDPDTVRGVDVVFYGFDRLPADELPDGFGQVPPTLAVEVLGKGQGWSKALEKGTEYLRLGVDSVWIVDPKRRRVCVLRQDDGPRIVGEAETLTDSVLPGFRCKVADFFR